MQNQSSDAHRKIQDRDGCAARAAAAAATNPSATPTPAFHGSKARRVYRPNPGEKPG
jgi:hypothetical protein